MTVPRSYTDIHEGGHVVRVTRHVQYPEDHKFVSSKEPLPIVHYAREMTLARGRILYEVTDAEYAWSFRSSFNVAIGYVVPAHILTEAIQRGRKSGNLSVAYAHLSHQERATFFSAYRKVKDKFPRIHETAVRIIAERLTSHGYQVTNSNIERAVVDHVSYMWTSYRFRTEQGESKESAKEAVKPRCREVLTTWLSRDLPFNQFDDLWRRWDLVDIPKKPTAYERSLVDKKPAVYSGATTYYAGKETVANLVCRSHTFL